MRLRLYDNLVRAQQTAQYLTQHGIAVKMFPLEDAGFARPRFELVLATRRQRARAEEILGEYEQESMVPETDWEEQSVPDLSRLDPNHCAVSCGACGASLPHDLDMTQCPECKAPYDLVERILEVHGPDALLDAFDEEGVDANAVVDAFDWHCERCDASLLSMPRRDRCPSCGNLYDKDEMFRKDFG